MLPKRIVKKPARKNLMPAKRICDDVSLPAIFKKFVSYFNNGKRTSPQCTTKHCGKRNIYFFSKYFFHFIMPLKFQIYLSTTNVRLFVKILFCCASEAAVTNTVGLIINSNTELSKKYPEQIHRLPQPQPYDRHRGRHSLF